jgi:hypothetical protein
MLSCNVKSVRERRVSRRDASSIALWQPTCAEMLVVLVYQQAKVGWSVLPCYFLCSFAGSLSVILLGVFLSGSAKYLKPVCC